jgi:hypothetical protein
MGDLSIGRLGRHIVAGLVLGIAPTTCLPQPQDAAGLPPEMAKLKRIQAIATETKFVAVTPAQEPSYCSALLRDLSAGNDVVPVEPDVRSDLAEDPRLDKWRRCDGASPEEMRTNDPALGFNLFASLGGPPFRYYRIDIDGEPGGGKEDVLYHELTRGDLKTGSTAYTWVDLRSCAIRASIPLRRFDRTPRNLRPADLIVRYKGEYVVVDMYTNSIHSDVPDYRMNAYRLNGRPPRACGWREGPSR